jgi:hypothetical protein
MRPSTSIRTVLTLALLCVPAICAAGPPGLGIFADIDGADCNVTIVPFQFCWLHVLYLGHGGPNATGAEYSIQGFPGVFGVDYLCDLFAAPGSNLNLGNAFDGIGHNVAWPEPQAFDVNGNLLCASYRFLVLNSGLALDGVTLRPACRYPPWQFCWGPLITDANFNLIFVAPGEAHVNAPGSCTVAVTPVTWTGVRNLYR